MRNLAGAILTGAVFLLSACSGEDDAEVTTINVTPSAASIEVLGGTLQFSAEVLDQRGNAMTETVLWSSDDENVATVDQSGRARALAEGTANISASVGNVAGTSALTVSSAPCTREISLATGEVEVLPTACDIFIPSGSAGDRYRVAILNQSTVESESEVSDATLVVTPVGAVGAPPAAAPGVPDAPGRPGPAARELSLEARKHLRWGRLLEDRTRAAHRGLRAAEAALFQALGPEAVLPDTRVEGGGPQRQAADLPDRLTLRNNDGSTCELGDEPTPAFLLAQNAYMAIFQDSALNADPATEVTPAEAQLMLDYYAEYGKDIIDDFFHGVPDIDGNGKIIVYISFDDDLEDGATAAYVWGGDLFDADDCATSNEAELTYFNSALVREVDEGFAQALETTVHEVKHISSFWQGIRRNEVLGLPNPFHPSWIEEGTAEIAANVATRVSWQDIGGPAPNDKVREEDIRDSAFDANDDVHPEALGIIIRMTRVQGYLASQPNGLIETPNGADERHSVYGSGWTFFRWLGDAYGDAATTPLADASFFTSQNDAGMQPGIRGVEAITGQSYDRLLEEFAAALMLHETGAPEGDRSYTSYDFVSSIEMFCFAADNPPCDGTSGGPPGTFPWPVTTTGSGVMGAPFDNATFDGRIGPSGIRIHEFVSQGGGGGIQLSISARQPARVVVTRIR